MNTLSTTPSAPKANGTQSTSQEILTSFHSIVQKQKTFFLTGQTRAVEFRKKNLKLLKQLIQSHNNKILKALEYDLGKPAIEAHSTEVSYVLKELDLILKNIDDLAQPKKVSTPSVLWPASSAIYPEPFGTVLILSPWNYPFQLAISPLIGALAAGNTVVLKPSELTTETEKLIKKLIQDNFSPDYIYCATGGASVAESLLNEKFDFIFFTGSTRVGQIVMQKASQHLTPVCLELGGKSPCLIDRDIDLKIAARRIVWGKFMNAGQTCVAPDFLYIHKDIKNDFIEQLKTTITEFYGSSPLESPSLARIVNLNHFNRLKSMLENSHILMGGHTNQTTLKIEPTLIDCKDWSHPLMQDEIFGPLLPILEYTNLDEVLQTLRLRPKPLAFYVFSNNSEIQDKVLETMPFGGACVNDCIVHLANPELPFGGIGSSGMGHYHGLYSFEVFSHKKSVMKKKFALDAAVRYPPYTELKSKILKLLAG